MRIVYARYNAVPAALALCVALGGCKPKDRGMAAGADSTMSSMAQPAESTAAVAGSTAVAAGSSATAMTKPAALTDANILALLDEVNAGDSALAAAAMPNLKSADAKSFARLMEGEHHALRLQTDLIAKKLNITMALPADDPIPAAAKGETDALQGKSGAAYDSTYIAQEVGIHKAVIGLAGTWHDAAQNAQIKKLIEQAGPVLTKHLDRAQAIAKKMEKSA
ncbi:MAG: DUF4142 domain-containing protein [Gemmatimonadaceae bacterium]